MTVRFSDLRPCPYRCGIAIAGRSFIACKLMVFVAPIEECFDCPIGGLTTKKFLQEVNSAQRQRSVRSDPSLSF